MKEREISEQCEINVYSYVSVYVCVNGAFQNRNKESRQYSVTSKSILASL